MESLDNALLLLASAMVVSGGLACAAASMGLLRFPDFFSRTHAAGVAGPLGAGLVILAIGISSDDPSLTLRCVFGFLFLVLTAPVGAHLLARAAYLTREGSENAADPDSEPADDYDPNDENDANDPNDPNDPNDQSASIYKQSAAQSHAPALKEVTPNTEQEDNADEPSR